MGALVNGAIHRMFDAWKGEDPEAFKGFVSSLMAKLLTNDIPIVNNPVLKSIVEQKTGVDLYTQRTIRPARLEHLSNPNQVYPWTTEPAKKISGFLNQIGVDSYPIGLEQMMRNWTGVVGTNILKTLDQGYLGVPGFNPNAQATDMANDPWFGSFFARNPGINAKSIGDFYDAYNKFTTAKADAALAKKQGDRSGARELRRSPDMRVNMDHAAKALSKIRTAVYAVQFDKTLSPDDKRQLIDKMADQMIVISERSLARFRKAHE
jgi:phage gp37-like protein